MNTQLKLKAARENYGAKEAEYRDLLASDTKMTPEFRSQLDAIKEEISILKDEVTRYEELEAAELRSAAAVGPAQNNAAEDKEKSNLFKLDEIMSSVFSGNLSGRAGELNQEALKRNREIGFGGAPSNGVNIPLDFWQLRSRKVQKRDVQATGSTTGAKYVPTETMSFIDALRNDIVMMNMGANMITGLGSNLRFPRKTAGAAVAASTENASSTETTPTVDSVDLAPNRITAFTDVSNQVTIQANEDILAITENDLYMATLVELQRQLIHGSGSSGEMLGLLGISGIGSISTATVTYAVIQNIMDEVFKDNAVINPNTTGWLTNSFVRKLLKQKEEIANSGYKIWANDNTIDGYNAYMTNSVSRVLGGGSDASALIFGDFSQFIIAQFGGINLQRNDQVKSKEALTEIVIHSWWDCDARHPESFAADVAITA